VTTTVRSVRVELEMGIASYVANAKIAGRETDAAFRSAEERISATSLAVSRLERNMANLSKTSAEARVGQSSLGREVDNTGAATERTSRKTKTYTLEMAIADEKTSRLRKSLRDQASASLDAESGLGRLERQLDKTGSSAGRADRSIDKYSGRLGLLLSVAAALGPALIPVGALGVPALAGLATQGGFAAAALGATVLAAHGVGDALKAVEAARLDPTTANLQAARDAMRDLAPAAQDLVHHLEDLRGVGRSLQFTAAGGILGGVDDALTSLETRLPAVQRILQIVSNTTGRAIRDGGESLASSKYDQFFAFLQHEARPELDAMADSVGNVAHGLAMLFVGTQPLQRDFADFLRSSTESFDEWATRLGNSKQFAEFVDYVETEGPKVEATVGAIANAFLQVLEAAAPLGGPTLETIKTLADALAAIADSPIGPGLYAGAAGMIALSRAAKPLASLNDVFLDLRTSPDRAATAVQRFGGAAKLAAGAAGIGLFVSSLQESNRSLSALEGAAGGALAGFSVGGPWGAAIGGAIGLVVDLGRSHEQTSQEVADLTATFDQQTGAITENTRVKIASQLQDKGLLDSAEELGIKTSLVTDAVMGNADAQAQLNAALAGYDVDHTVTSAKDLQASFSDQEIAAILADRAATNLRDNIPGLAGQFSSAAGNAKQLAGAVDDTAGSMDRGKTSAERLIGALDHLNNRLERRADARDYQAAIDDFTKALKENGKALDINGPKGRAVQAALDNIAASAVRLVQDLHGSDRAAALTQARKDFVDAATKLLGSRDAAQQLANTLGILNKTRAAPNVTLPGVGEAIGQARTLKGVLDSLHSKDIDIALHYQTLGNKPSAPLPGGQPGADGMTVPGPRYPYGDKVLAHLAPGEEVISNRHGQADRFRADRSAGRIPAYAGGGTVEDRIANTYKRQTPNQG
jgi:hypothetical protein